MSDTATADDAVLDRLAEIVGADGVVTDAEERAYFAQDYYAKGAKPRAVIAPKNVDDLARAVGAATAAGLAVIPRGGGYSYTSGYLSAHDSILVDTRNLDRIVEINETDMYVTVEAGCTWANLYKALKAKGLRTPFWGPFSGLHATVGGGIAQGALSWGSGLYGMSSGAVLDMAVVLADGSLIRTGVSGQPDHPPFFRNYGPDMTGLFCNDCGALGIKATVTLKLIERPRHTVAMSFGFPSLEDAAAAAARVARAGVASDNVGAPGVTLREGAKSESLVEDLKALWKIGKAGNGPLDSAKRMAKVAMAGRRFLNDLAFAYSFIVEAPSAAMAKEQARIVKGLIGGKGVEIPNTMPAALLAEPFADHDMLSFTGQRQLPPSTIVPLSQFVPLHQAFVAALEPLAAEMARFNMTAFPVTTTVGTTGFLYEPVIAWDDAPEEFHRRHTNPKLVAIADKASPTEEGRALAGKVRQIFIDKAFEHGGVHVQIGRVYPYLKERDPAAIALLQAVKGQLDPKGLMNPGSLGL